MKNINFYILCSLSLISMTHCAYNAPNLKHYSLNCELCTPNEPILYEDSLAIIIKKQPSLLRTSLLIIPKKHLENLNEVDLDTRSGQQLLAHLLSLAQMLASRLSGAQNYRITINNGNSLQKKPHLCLEFESNEYLNKA